MPPCRQISVAPRSQASTRAPDDLAVRDEVGLAAEVRGELPLREGAEAAAEVADVRVLDVARDDVGDDVAVDLAAQAVGGGEDALALLAAGAEEAHDLLLVELAARPGAAAGRGGRRRAARLGLARRPGVLAGEPERVGAAQHARQHALGRSTRRRCGRDRRSGAARARGRGSRSRARAARAPARAPRG